MLKFNNISMPSFVKVRAISITALPSININLKGNSVGYGTLAGKTSFGEKYIKADVTLMIPHDYTLQKCARELGMWLKGNNFELSPLILQDDPEIRYMAKISNSVDISDLIYIGQGTLEFVVPSGCGESVNEKTVTGVTKATLNYSGSQRSFPKIEITLSKAATNFSVNHVQTGNAVFLNGSFGAGDKIIIDCSKQLVKVNNELHMEIVGLTSKFMLFEYGVNEISCSVTDSNLKVICRERFL